MQELDTQSVDIALHVSYTPLMLTQEIVCIVFTVFKEKSSSSVVSSGVICQYDNGITWKSRKSFACEL